MRSTILDDIVPGCASTRPHPVGERRDDENSLGQVPRLTVIARGLRLRSIWNRTESPGCFRDTRHIKSSTPWIGPPSSSKITSLARMPARAAEVSLLTSTTNTPRSGRPRIWLSASVKSDTTTPTRATACARNDVCHDITAMVTNSSSTTCLVRFMRPDPLCITSPGHTTGVLNHAYSQPTEPVTEMIHALTMLLENRAAPRDLPIHDQAAARRATISTSRFGAVLACVAYRVSPVNARPPTKLPRTVGISFQMK